MPPPRPRLTAEQHRAVARLFRRSATIYRDSAAAIRPGTNIEQFRWLMEQAKVLSQRADQHEAAARALDSTPPPDR